jgi:hypothetical protein
MAHNAGSRKPVEPRKRKKSPSERRRDVQRARNHASKTLNAIQAKAGERQALYAEGNHPNLTERLSTDLNGRQGLFEQYRDRQLDIRIAQDRPHGPDYRGHTTRLKQR